MFELHPFQIAAKFLSLCGVAQLPFCASFEPNHHHHHYFNRVQLVQKWIVLITSISHIGFKNA